MAELMWKMAIIIDVLHLVVVPPMIILAGLGKVFGKNMGRAFVFVVVGLQAAFLNCPLTVLTGWMRSYKDPSIDPFETSFVHWLYAHLGPFGNLHWVISAVLFAAAGISIHSAYQHRFNPEALLS